MAINSLFNKFKGKDSSELAESSAPVDSNSAVEGEVDYIWMTANDSESKKPKVEKIKREDTAIMRARIQEKLAKLNNH